MRLIDADKLKDDFFDDIDDGIPADIAYCPKESEFSFEDVIDHIDRAPTVKAFGHWTSVKDRLPPYEAIVLVCILEDDYVAQGYLDGDGYWYVNDEKLANVDYWMPRPKPPKDENDG